jgi:hypothetical protein
LRAGGSSQRLTGTVVTAVGIAALWVVPGTVLARLLAGPSWLRSVALSPVLSILLLSFAGAILGLADIPATVLSTSVVLVLGLGLTALLLRHRVRNRPPAKGEDDRWTLLGAGIGGLLGAAVWGLPSTWLTRPPQSWDYLWHQYVVATISRRGLMGPQNLVPVDGLEEAFHTYQHGAHLAAGLVVGDGVPAVASGLNLTLWFTVVVFLPLGTAALTRCLTPNRAAVLLAPALVVLLPNGVFSRFGLFAFVVGLALLPSVALTGVIQVRKPSFADGLLLTLALTGLVLTHAHVFLAATILLVFLWVGRQLAVAFHLPTDEADAGPNALAWFRSGVALAVPLLAALLLASPWLFLATGVHGTGLESGLMSAEHVREPGFEGVSAALGVLVTGQRLDDFVGSANPLLGVAIPLGALYLLWRRRHLGLALFVLFFLWMTVVVAGGSGRLRELVATPWLGDWWRPTVILSVAGALVIALALGDATSRISSAGWAAPARVTLIVLLIAPVGLSLLAQVPEARKELAAIHGPLAMSRAAPSLMDSDTLERELASDQPLMVLSPLEVRAMTQLSDITPAGTRVLNWWGDGSSWMYSAGGLVPVRIYPSHSVSVQDVLLVEETLGDPTGYDEAIDALVALDVCSAYTAAGHILSQGLPEPPAWTELAELPGFELAYRNEHARVYRAADPRLTANC